MCNQVVIDLGAAPLDGEADWYTLTSHEESLQILVSIQLYADCFAASDQIRCTNENLVCAAPSRNANVRVGHITSGFSRSFITAVDVVPFVRLGTRPL